MRILSGLRYVDEAGPRVYTANSMTREMTSRYAVAKSKFMYAFCASSYVLKVVTG